MSEQERINLYDKLGEAMRLSTQKMLDTKLRLGQNVVIADANGKPVEVSAAEALRLIKSSYAE